MMMAKKLQHEGKHISASFKTVILVAVVGVAASVFAAFEAPRSILAPDEPVAMMATVVLPADKSPVTSAGSAQASAEPAARPDQHAPAIASR